MSKAKPTYRGIQVCAHWRGLPEAVFMGTLYASMVRGKEIFSFGLPIWTGDNDFKNLGVVTFTTAELLAKLAIRGTQ